MSFSCRLCKSETYVIRRYVNRRNNLLYRQYCANKDCHLEGNFLKFENVDLSLVVGYKEDADSIRRKSIMTKGEAKRKRRLTNKINKYIAETKRRRGYKKHSAEFLASREWAELRYIALKKYGFRCLACGLTAETTTLHVDHIKPRSRYPHLELDVNNLQVLCAQCNMGKSDRFEDDLRPSAT